MASGDLIKYANFTSNPQEKIIYEADTGSSSGWNIVYISAASWRTFVYVKKNWMSYARTLRLNCSYYDGSKWVKQVEWSRKFAQTDSVELYYHWGHNSTVFNNLSVGNGVNKIDGTDVPSAPLWKLAFYHPELYLKRFKIYTDGIGGMPESVYDSICKGKPIYSAGSLTGESYYYAGQFDSESTEFDDTAVSLFWRTGKGSPIMAENQHKLIY